MIAREDLDPSHWESIRIQERAASYGGQLKLVACNWCQSLATHLVDRKSPIQGLRYVDGACAEHIAIWAPSALQENELSETEPDLHPFTPEAANKRLCATCGLGVRSRFHRVEGAQQVLPEDATNLAVMECYHCHWRGEIAYNIGDGTLAGWCGQCGKDDKLSTTLSSPPTATPDGQETAGLAVVQPILPQPPEPAPFPAVPFPVELPLPAGAPEHSEHHIRQRDEGWGWWTVIEGLRNWVDEQRTKVPFPDHSMIPIGQQTPMELHEKLQQFGSYLTHLYGLHGMQEGVHIALSKTYASAISAAKARAEDAMRAEKLPTALITESAKESRALNDPDIGEALRETRRRAIEAEALLALLHGMIKAYDAAWTTTSRQLTGTLGEMELEKGTRTA